MNKFNNLLKNVLIFLVTFLIINFIFQSCQNKEEKISMNEGNIVFLTTKNEYSRLQKVQVEVTNYTDQEITIKNECPKEPFNVYKYEKNKWEQKTANPDIDCSNAKDITLIPEKETIITYENWNHALFSEMGRFKIGFDVKTGKENKTVETNEFIIVKEGILKQLWHGIFYRPIYNGLIFIARVIPGHSLGFAIILLTLLIRTILLLPSHKSMVAQKKLQEIQPRLEKIKKKHKGDQQKIAMETMNIWKEAKVNPFGSCLPLLMQFPFLIALFYVIKGGLNPDNSFMLYKEYSSFGLKNINVIFLGVLNLTKANIYVLPLIVGGLQFIQVKLSTANKKKQNKEAKEKDQMAMATNMMAYVMPVMIAVFTASLPAGVGLYWGTSTSYAIIQQAIVNKSKTPENSNSVKVKVINK